MNFGNQIKTLREKRAWTQNDLADASQLSVRTIQRIESSENKAKGHSLNALKSVFGDELLSDDEIPDTVRIILMSCYSFMIIPCGNVIFPIVLWYRNRENKAVDQLARLIINFQITWYLISAAVAFSMVQIQPLFEINLIFMATVSMALINLAFLIRATRRLNQNNWELYPPSFKVL